ncbi:hypothetical protein [Asticcacaulis sp.]|nr:hypothetical protein [Asticcacaulis sp.]
MPASHTPNPDLKSEDSRRPKAMGPYLWLWFAALTGIIFGLVALSWG